MATRFAAVYEHGSQEIKDYSIDWTATLVAESDTATSSVWGNESSSTPTLGNGTNGAPAPVLSGSVATVWVVEGTIGDEYHLTNLLTTTGGRTFEKTIKIIIIDK